MINPTGVKAIIMAGGKGTRLFPLTAEIPKPMVPILNEPLIVRTVRRLHEAGITDIAITLSHMPEIIAETLNSTFGNVFRYYVETQPLGTAGSVRAAADFLDTTFIVLSGDAETDIDLSDMLAHHRRFGTQATMALTTVDDPKGFGLAEVHNRLVSRFVEKPENPDSNLINCGIYILEPGLLDRIPKNAQYDFGRNFFPSYLADGGKVSAYIHDAYWSDIGTPASYLRAHVDRLGGTNCIDPSAVLMPGAVLEGNVTAGMGSTLMPGIYRDCVIMPGSVCKVGVSACICSDKYAVYPFAEAIGERLPDQMHKFG